MVASRVPGTNLRPQKDPLGVTAAAGACVVLLVLGGSPSSFAIVARVADTIRTRRGAGVITRERHVVWY